jgi:hypothetical protein
MRRTGARAAVTGALLACLAGSPAPAVSAPAHGPAHLTTAAGWHRLHPALCHTVGDREPLP